MKLVTLHAFQKIQDLPLIDTREIFLKKSLRFTGDFPVFGSYRLLLSFSVTQSLGEEIKHKIRFVSEQLSIRSQNVHVPSVAPEPHQTSQLFGTWSVTGEASYIPKIARPSLN